MQFLSWVCATLSNGPLMAKLLGDRLIWFKQRTANNWEFIYFIQYLTKGTVLVQHELLFQCTEHSKTLSRIQKYLITMVSWLQALWRVFSFVCVHLLSLIYIIRNRGLIYRYYEFSRVILKTARFRRRYENSRSWNLFICLEEGSRHS